MVPDLLQEMLWCVHRIKNLRRPIRKPDHPVGLIVAELDAMMEFEILLGLVPGLTQ